MAQAAQVEQEKGFGIGDLFAIRDYRLLWVGQVISDLGDGMTNLAVLLLINHLTGSTAALATMAILLALPNLTFGLFAGVLVDRFDRKKIMILSDLLRGLVFVDSAQDIWLLYLIGFVQASISTFFTPARGALIPNIVAKKGLLTANSVSQTSRIIFNVLGTGLAGFLIGSFDQYWMAFSADALTFFISMLLILQIRYAHTPGADKAPLNARRVLGELIEGLKLTFSNRILSGAITAFAVTMLGLGAVNILLVPMLVNDLKVAETWFAAIELSQTIGMILAGAAIAMLASRFKATNILASGLILLGVTVAALALPTAVWQVLVILFFAGLFVTPIQASGATIIQTAVPDDVRGRTGAANNALITTAQLVSMALAGVLADLVGARNVFVIGGVVVAAAGFVALLIFRGVEFKPAEPVEMRMAESSQAEAAD